MIKKNISDLALFGGPSIFETVRPIGQLTLPNDEEFFKYTRRLFKKDVDDNDTLVVELEMRLAKKHQVSHCICFCSASLALILLMEALSHGRKGEVIMPAFTYVGLPHLAQWAGQSPRFCDIDIETHTLDPESVEKAICMDTVAILAVHQANSLCLIDQLQVLAEAHKLPLIFDSVHGIHCTYRGRQTGGFGNAEVFCLHATKLLNGFEGGYITTNDNKLADILIKKRQFGMDEKGNIFTLGLDARLNEMHAASALACLENQPNIIRQNQERVLAYITHFQDIPGIKWIPYQKDNEKKNYEFALLEIDPTWPLERDDIIKILRAENALARPYYSPPLHQSEHMPDNMIAPSLPVTEKVARNIIQMPVGDMVNVDDIKILSHLFRFIHKNSNLISEYLHQNRAKN